MMGQKNARKVDFFQFSSKIYYINGMSIEMYSGTPFIWTPRDMIKCSHYPVVPAY